MCIFIPLFIVFKWNMDHAVRIWWGKGENGKEKGKCLVARDGKDRGERKERGEEEDWST